MIADILRDQKRAAARAAVEEVRDGMRVGIGTGSSVAFAIEALGELCRGGLRIEGVATSLRTEAAARRAGVPIVDFAAFDAVDLCIDGVDEIDPEFRAIKGGGGAMLREKIVAASARRMIAICDMSKRVDTLGEAPIPVETLPFAQGAVARAIGRLGGRAVLRMAGPDAPARTDQGNVILDCVFGPVTEPAALAAALSSIPGMLGHGLFIDEIDALYIGTDHGVVQSDRSLSFSVDTRQ